MTPGRQCFPQWKEPMEKKNISAKEVTNRGLIFKICNSSCRSTLKKKKNKLVSLIKKYLEDLNTHFSKEGRPLSKKNMKRHWTSVSIREIQIKTTMRYQFIPVRMTIMKKSKNNKCWRGCGAKGSLVHCWWECRLVQPLWKRVSVQFSRSVVSGSMKVLKRLKIRLTIWYSNLTLGHISKENHNLKRYMIPNIRCSTIYNARR